MPFKSSRVLIVKGDSPTTIARKAGVSVAVITAAFAGIGVAANKIPIASIVTCGSVSKCTATVPSAYLVDVSGVVDPGQLSEACDAMTADDRGDVGAKAS